jgi:hypothetical protein
MATLFGRIQQMQIKRSKTFLYDKVENFDQHLWK